MTEEFAAAIVDWRDADDDVTAGGAESQIYAQKSPAYAAKNAAFESIEELALVNGATREILYGEDANLNGVLDPNEDDGEKTLPADNADGKLDAGMLAYVTVFSRESNDAERRNGAHQSHAARTERGAGSIAHREVRRDPRGGDIAWPFGPAGATRSRARVFTPGAE